MLNQGHNSPGIVFNIIEYVSTVFMATRKKRLQKHKASSAQQTPPQQKAKHTFSCLCTQRCKGRLRQLTRITYLRHAQFREIDAQQEAQAADLSQANERIALSLENESSSDSESGKAKVGNVVTSHLIFSHLNYCLKFTGNSALRHRV